MANNSGASEKRSGSEMGPHEEFLELCAVSTSGDLTEEEQRRLRAHLAECSECRQALREFESAVDVGVPLLASKLSVLPSEESVSEQSLQERVAEGARSSRSVKSANANANDNLSSSDPGERGFAFAGRYRYRPSQINWNYVWMPFAACIILAVALGIYAYRVTWDRNQTAAQRIAVPNEAQIVALEQRISDAGHESQSLKDEIGQRDAVIAELRRQTEQQSKLLAEMKSAAADLERSMQNNTVEKQQALNDRTALTEKFETAQSSLQKMQTELDSVKKQREVAEARELSLQDQIKDLSAQLRSQTQTVAKQDELLSHDRDIRDLMGARKLYVVDVYDVGRDGATQKPYGRVFYTKGKSLIFYAYDLDQESGVRNASTFQAWGRRGPDRKEALNLGILYEDNASKKRWVLKFDDPKALDEIDAVFVTVEPHGGSQKPSGKPLLSAYLQIAPNHP
jgi:anti-sigma factor RsiW